MKIHATSSDGVWSIIEAKDLPPNCPRSKTAATVAEAMKATWEPALTRAPGPKSQNAFVKVKSADLATPAFIGQLSPAKYGAPVRRVIADYPHRCHVCGGRTLELFSSVEHEGGACPGAAKRQIARRIHA